VVAAKGVLGDRNLLGDSPCRSLADSGARVPKVLPTAELEGFLTGLIVAALFLSFFGAYFWCLVLCFTPLRKSAGRLGSPRSCATSPPSRNNKMGRGDLVLKHVNLGGHRHLVLDVAFNHEFGGRSSG